MSAVGPRQREEMRIDVRRVTVVIRRLLEIDAVRAHLFRRLVEQYLQPQIAPPFGTVQLRQRQAQVEQSQSLAGQVRVGAEIIREVSLYVQPVRDQRFQQPREEIGRDLSGINAQAQRPQPRD